MISAQAAVGVLHPGQMGAAFAAQLRATGRPVLWCPAGRSTATADRARDGDLSPVDLTELLDRAEVLLSICPPEFAEDVAAAAVQGGYRGVFVEANAINPARTVRIADRFTAAGGRCCDAAIIGPPPRTGSTARLYLSGAAACTTPVAALFTGTAIETVIIDERIGSASALKMAYAGYQKATRALAGVAHALADHHGVTEHLLTEAQRNARSPLADPGYLPSVAARAWRWAPELRDVADTLTDAGLPGDLAAGGAAVLDRWREDKDTTLPVATVLEHLRHAD